MRHPDTIQADLNGLERFNDMCTLLNKALDNGDITSSEYIKTKKDLEDQYNVSYDDPSDDNHLEQS